MLFTRLMRSGRLIFAGDMGGPACVVETEASKAANKSFVFMAGGRVGLYCLDLSLLLKMVPHELTRLDAPEVCP